MKNEYKKDEELLPTLVKLGLSKDAARCYLVLFRGDSLTSGEIAAKIEILPSAVYRLTKKLKEKGLIVELKVYPVKYQAIPPEIAVESLTSQKIKDLEKSKISIISSLKNDDRNNAQTKMEILTGQKKLMERYVDLAKQINNEILIISIGEPVPDEVKLTNRDVMERGVNIKFLVHKYDKSNIELLRSWVRMGLEVRYYKDSGYHLVIFDGNITILSTNNPKNTMERTSIVINNEKLSKALRNYFYSIWDKALPVKVY